MNQHAIANAFQFHLTKKQSIHCSSTRSWLIHTRLLWLIIAHAAYNTRMACKIPRHDHEYITFTRPSTCCHLSLIVQALTTNGKHSLLLPKTRFLAYDIADSSSCPWVCVCGLGPRCLYMQLIISRIKVLTKSTLPLKTSYFFIPQIWRTQKEEL